MRHLSAICRIVVILNVLVGSSLFAQDKSDVPAATAEANPADSKAATDGKEEATEPKYPLSVATSENVRFVVDLDLPGVWKISPEGDLELLLRGSKWLRKALNRPRAVSLAPGGDLLIADTASRDIYRVPSGGGEPKPLTDGYIGIPMSMAIDGDENVYVADLETRFILRFPIAGGDVETFAKVNTRGLFIDSKGVLWAVTQQEDQLVTFNDKGEPTAVVKGRPFQFPHNVVVTESGDAYVTDGYAKAIWHIPPGGEATRWVEGDPLKNPVGLALEGESLLVADPHAKTVFKIDLKSKKIENLF